MKTFKNGDKYLGEWFDDKCNGEGRFEKTDGGYYDGDWLNNMAHGTGK